MKELDIVKLVNDFMGVNAGTEGVIVGVGKERIDFGKIIGF